MRVVPFPVPGSASSGMVIFRVPHQNWTKCAVGMPVGGFVVSVRTTIAMARRATQRAAGDKVDDNGDGLTGYNEDDDGDGRQPRQ